MNLNIVMYSEGGSDSGHWTEGVNPSAIDACLKDFDKQIESAKETILKTTGVKDSLNANWKGADCDMFLAKLDQNANNICDQIDEYVTAIHTEVERIIQDWATFQSGHIS